MKSLPTFDNYNPEDHGFCCGLEVHQQLNTAKKLFCNCPAGQYSDHYDARVLRHMRPTLSELGEYDGTALMEFKTRKEILYLINKETVCTYEMDDNPPFPINREAVDYAIEIALMLNCSIVGELHVARKQYLDGSIPAGFQRTAIIGWNGWIPYKDRKIGIIQLGIEEDSCREVTDHGHRRSYLTDRLSMPLIEVVTAPDMLNPTEAYEVGVIIGNLLRMSGRVRRGIGSVRQDVNVSVTGGTRIEIKGVPRLPLIPKLVHFEALRQSKLLELSKILISRGFNSDKEFTADFDITEDIELPITDRHEVDDFKVSAIVLRKMSGLLTMPIGPNRTFVDDIAGRVRVIACLHDQPSLMHTEKGSSLSLSDSARKTVTEMIGMTDEDSAIIAWGSQLDVETALTEIRLRCIDAIDRIPNETRQVLESGETDFERVLPGADRMYPDTDSPPLPLTDKMVSEIRNNLNERPWERLDRLVKIGLSGHLVGVMLLSPYIDLYYELMNDKITSPILAAYVLGELTVHYRRRGGNPDLLTNDSLRRLFGLFSAGKIVRETFRPLIEAASKRESVEWDVILKQAGHSIDYHQESEKKILEILQLFEGETPVDADKKCRNLTGYVMNEIAGTLNGKVVWDIVKKYLKLMGN